MQLKLSGSTMEYTRTGSGPPVLLLHAFPLCKEMWEGQIVALRATHEVIAPDHRGFGGTTAFSGPPSIDQMADDAARLLDALRITQPVIVGGVSMGGYVALAFARRHAARVRAMILADSKADPDTAEGKANRDKSIAFMKDHTALDLIEQMMPKMVSQQTMTQRPAVVEQIRKFAGRQTQAGVIGGLEALRDRPDANPGLAKIAVPTLVLVGSEDAITPPSVSLAMAGRIQRATVHVISGAGHLANLERPEEFNRLMMEFLGKL